MTTQANALAILAAAEGSYFTYKGRVTDQRYVANFARNLKVPETKNSSLSFGATQLDTGNNSYARSALDEMLAQLVSAQTITAQKRDSLSKFCKKKGLMRSSFTDADFAIVNTMIGSLEGRSIIDKYDRAYFSPLWTQTDDIIATAAKVWETKKLTGTCFADGTAEQLRLFAYIIATLNRNPTANTQTIVDWLAGKDATAGGVVHKLKAPPEIADMDAFFGVFRIWKGNPFKNLNDRLHDTLAACLPAK